MEQTDHVILARWIDLVKVRIVDFAVPADNRLNLKEIKNRDKYMDIAREQKSMEHERKRDTNCKWQLGTDKKGLIHGLEDWEILRQVESIQTTALLRSATILKRVLDIWGDKQSLRLQWKQPVNASVKNSQNSKIIIRRKTTLWAFQTTTKHHHTPENLDLAKKKKETLREK